MVSLPVLWGVDRSVARHEVVATAGSLNLPRRGPHADPMTPPDHATLAIVTTSSLFAGRSQWRWHRVIRRAAALADAWGL